MEPKGDGTETVQLTLGSAATKNDGTDGYAIGVLPPGMDDGALGSRAGETGIGVRG